MPKTTFVGIKAPISEDALAIKQTIENISEENLDSKSHPEFLQQFYRKVVNVNFDGASVMSGHVAGVQALMNKHSQTGPRLCQIFAVFSQISIQQIPNSRKLV